MPPSATLKWLERALLVGGLVLGSWALFIVGQNWYYARMPVPAVDRSERGQVLPGEEAGDPVGTSGAARRHIARGSWLARLEAPTVRLAATVLEGSDDRTLRRAAGHIEYTPFPGEPGNIGIAGHRDTTFYAVRNLKAGDPLTLTTAGRVFDYKVSKTMIVDPKDVEVLDPTEQPALTLVTCYPFNFIGNAPKRFIVRAELVGERERP
jgi:LPXTG-site transpeptidase (sortase) family protein